MPGQDITIAGPDGDFTGYLSLPPSGKGPGIVVLQEIFGVNHVMRDLCDHYAAQGYVALCPDLFWRIEPNIQITDKTEAEWARAFELFQAFNVDKGLTDIAATIDALRSHQACSGKVGAVGYCLGGLLAYLTACRTSADASVGYYGVGIQDRTQEAEGLDRPLLLHIAGKDEFVAEDAQKIIHDRLSGHAQITLFDYPQDDHAFAREGGAHYNPDSAKLADERTLALFRSALS